MTIKEKSWIWKLTFPFAHKSFTVIGNTIYCPKGSTPSEGIIKHEEIHIKQRKAVGSFKFYFLYLFALPLFFNPFRKKWEIEAYTKGQGFTEEHARKMLRRAMYGWLI